MATYRLTRTVTDGQFENDKCFTTWLESLDHAVAHLVDMRIDPINKIAKEKNLAAKALGVNVATLAGHRYYLWVQETDVKTMKCPNSDPDLVTHAGKSGWPTEAEARAVMNAKMGESEKIVAQVEKAKEIDPVKWARDLADDVGDELGKLPWWVPVGVVGLTATALWALFRR